MRDWSIHADDHNGYEFHYTVSFGIVMNSEFFWPKKCSGHGAPAATVPTPMDEDCHVHMNEVHELKEEELGELQIVKKQIVTVALVKLSPAINLLNS